jgi:hypothetical protein
MTNSDESAIDISKKYKHGEAQVLQKGSLGHDILPHWCVALEECWTRDYIFKMTIA